MSEIKLKLYLKTFVNHFKNQFILFLSLIIVISVYCYKKIVSIVNYLFQTFIYFLKKLNSIKRKILLIFVKLLCFQMLFYSAVLMTEDYLSFPFKYKLIVSDNSNGFELPPIRICTEKQMFFDKNKIYKYFNLSEVYKDYERYISQKLRDHDYLEYNQTVEIIDKRFMRELFIERLKNYFMSQMYTYIKPNISSLKFNEMSDLLIKSNQLFNISTECHSCGQNKVNEQNFDVLQSIYRNQFGMCFTFTQNNKKYMKKDEHVNLNIAFEAQNNFAFDAIFNPSPYKTIGDVYSSAYFVLFYSIFDKNRQIFEKMGTNLKIRRTGMSARFRFSRTTVKMLSTPYTEKCENQGKFNNFKIHKFNQTLPLLC